jgi:hypothetical protein
MDYDLDLKYWHMDQSRKYYAKWQKPNTKYHILDDPIYIKYL